MIDYNNKVLEVKDLVISFKTDRGIVHAVRGVSFDLHKGETLCIVGESGSGKSVTNKAVMGISAKNAIIERGSILYEGEDLTRISEEEFHRIRGKKIGMIFQDPLSALNPVMRIGKQIIEATMHNKDILKKKYNDLISPELAAFRNNEANLHYHVASIQNEIGVNAKLAERIANLQKAIASYEKKLASADEKKRPVLEQSKADLEKKLEDAMFDYSEYRIGLTKIVGNEVESLRAGIEARKAKAIDDPIKAKINEDAIASDEAVLAYLERPEFIAMSEDAVASLLNRNKELIELLKIHTANFKRCNPALKEDFARAKKKAKAEVDAYGKQIKGIHLENLSKLQAQLRAVEAEIGSTRALLTEAELSAIDEVIKYNAKLAAKRKKEAQKFRETSISKTVATTEEFKVIPHEGIAKLLEQKQSVLDAIDAENRDYISKTKITKAEAKRLALKVMEEVGIPMPERRFKQYPFEFSGGMRQRIVIAIALTANPEILICDEPTTALDVTIQAQILSLINRLKEERNLSCIFITHDLGVVANMADRVAVMYAGKIVEYGTANEIFFEPKHPYTWALLSSIPDVDSKERLVAIPGTPPDMIYPPKGDAFAARNAYALAIDFKAEPPYFKVSDTHYAATWLLHEDAPKVEMPKIVAERIRHALEKGEEK